MTNTGNISFVPNKEGAIITVYKSSPKFGYLELQSEELDYDTRQYRVCLLRANIELLEKFVQSFSESKLPGRIVIHEFLEDEVPENFKSRIDKNKPWKEAILPFVKKLKVLETDKPLTENQIILKRTLNLDDDGFQTTRIDFKHILKFADYDPTGKIKDTYLKIEETKIYRLPIVNLNENARDNYTYLDGKNQKPDNSFSNKTQSQTNDTIKQNHVNENSVNKVNPAFNQSPKNKSSKRSKGAIIAIAVILCLAMVVIKPSSILLIGALAIIGIIAMIIGSVANAVFDSYSNWSWIITIIVGVIVIYFLGSVFDGCGVSEPDSGWRRP